MNQNVARIKSQILHHAAEARWLHDMVAAMRKEVAACIHLGAHDLRHHLMAQIAIENRRANMLDMAVGELKQQLYGAGA